MRRLRFPLICILSMALSLFAPKSLAEFKTEKSAARKVTKVRLGLPLLLALSSKDEKVARQAEERILKQKERGFRLLLSGTRMAGEENALGFMLRSLGCGKSGPPSRSPVPAYQAAALLGQWLADDPSLALTLVRSKSVFERRIALASQIGKAESLLKILVEYGKQGYRGEPYLYSALQTMQCLHDTDSEGLSRLSRELSDTTITLQGFRDKTGWPKHCSAPDHDIKGLGEAMSEGKWFYAGSHWTDKELTLNIKQFHDKGFVFMSPRCAWKLYEQQATAGQHRTYLLEALVSSSMVPISLQRKAAQRLVDDIDFAEDKRQNDFLALAINAGATSKRKVQVDPKRTHHRAHILEAAFRQGQEGIRGVIERHLRCPHPKSRCPECRLLGLLKTPASVEEAWMRFQQCPGSLQGATIALIWAEDPRAPDALERLLEKGAPVGSEVYHALAEKGSAALRALLAAKAKEGNRHALKIRTALDWKD